MARNTICLEQHSTSFETWVEKMGDEKLFCDELSLMGLCSLYKKHCVVLTKDKLWSSIEAESPPQTDGTVQSLHHTSSVLRQAFNLAP